MPAEAVAARINRQSGNAHQPRDKPSNPGISSAIHRKTRPLSQSMFPGIGRSRGLRTPNRPVGGAREEGKMEIRLPRFEAG